MVRTISGSQFDEFIKEAKGRITELVNLGGREIETVNEFQGRLNVGEVRSLLSIEDHHKPLDDEILWPLETALHEFPNREFFLGACVLKDGEKCSFWGMFTVPSDDSNEEVFKLFSKFVPAP